MWVDFITVQNLVRIGSVLLIILMFNDFCDLAGDFLFTPLLEQFFTYTGVKNAWTDRDEILHGGRVPQSSDPCKAGWLPI